MPSESRVRWISLRDELFALRTELVASEQRSSAWIAEVQPGQRASARNLVHYLALRRGDQRNLQGRLSSEGLSSLGRSESYVMASLDAVLRVLQALIAGTDDHGQQAPAALTRERGQALIAEHAAQLLGPPPAQRRVRIMVTLPTEAASDPALVHELIRRGMDCARINAAHDDVAVWRAMARHVRDAATALGRPCTIAVDLPGPKCRTGALQPGPQVRKLRPVRDRLGAVLAPARAWLTVDEQSTRPHALPVSAEFLSRLDSHSQLTLRDARGRLRHFRVSSLDAGDVEIESDRTSYVQTGSQLRCAAHEVAIGPLPASEQPLLLHVDDTLALTRAGTPGGPARFSTQHGCDPSDSTQIAPAHIPCEPPELVDMVCVGESVWLDDGKIGGVVTSVETERFLVRITAARPAGDKLRAGKGINLPDSNIRLRALTAADLDALAFAAEAADLVSLSFVHDPADVRALQDQLSKVGRPELGVILKIETRRGFERLPELMLTAMRSGCPGVMIARGDLAVECGFERLAELQEEILWLSEAAHVPVVWATQVLETLAKTGRPTRAEVSDAGLAERAECVMLNKGPHIAEAVTVLDDILRRMSAHQEKKTATFRSLQVAERFQQRLELAPPEPQRS